MTFCPTCNCTDCLGHCARATDMQAIEQQHQRDCAAVDADANPRKQGKAYCQCVKDHVLAALLDSHASFIATRELLDSVQVDAFIAGAKWACGAVDYQKERENQS